MASVVFLRAVNVGVTNRCQPALIARQLARLDVVNIGAVGTLVVRGEVDESTLRRAIAQQLNFKCEIMICPARDLIKLVANDPFAGQQLDPEITRFVSILHNPLNSSQVTRHSSLCLPSDNDWLLKIIAIQNRFVVGIYRRHTKAISYLGKLEKMLGVPGTVRNWNTIEKVAKILNAD